MSFRRWMPLLLASAAVACGSTPSGPSPQSNNTSSTYVVNGRLTATGTGQALSGATIELAGTTTTTDAEGAFHYDLPRSLGGSAAQIKISGAGLLDRLFYFGVTGSRDVALDAISLGSGFSLDYYRMLVRDSIGSPGSPRSLRRWATAPRLYVKTVDEAGAPIEAATLEPVIRALQDEASAWTGGRFGLAGLDRGTESREGVPGWITVKWPSTTSDNLCGRAQIAVNGGWIEFYYQNRNCACGGSRIDPGTARHELGHAMGFYHTSDPGDAMYPGGSRCDDRPSARERFHAAIAYSRAIGNTDPDNDPSGAIASFRTEPAPIVVD